MVSYKNKLKCLYKEKIHYVSHTTQDKTISICPLERLYLKNHILKEYDHIRL